MNGMCRITKNCCLYLDVVRGIIINRAIKYKSRFTAPGVVYLLSSILS